MMHGWCFFPRVVPVNNYGSLEEDVQEDVRGQIQKEGSEADFALSRVPVVHSQRRRYRTGLLFITVIALWYRMLFLLLL